MSDEPSRDDITPEQLAGHLEFFGCVDDEESNGPLGDAVIEWYDEAHAGPGWYMHCGEYPDEGSVFLSAKEEPFPALEKLLQEQEARDGT